MSPAKRNPGQGADIFPPPERLVFAANFKRARKAASLTQDAIRDKTGFAQPFISEVENGLSSINIDNMARLANVVNVPLWELLKPYR